MSAPGTIDTVLLYGRSNLINQGKNLQSQDLVNVNDILNIGFQDFLDDVDFFKSRGIGLINASPLVLGLLTNELKIPEWHNAPLIMRRYVEKASKYCRENNISLGK